jgi:hypothetical protein
MKIYILSNTMQEIAEYLDDRSLDKMIKAIAQVVCNVHNDLINDSFFESSKYSDHCRDMRDQLRSEIPLEPIFAFKTGILQWSQWVRECVANYNHLVKLGLALDKEHEHRFSFKYTEATKHHKLYKVLLWARDNVPSLPSHCHSCALCYNETPEGCKHCQKTTEFPLVMPRRYYQNNKISIQPGIYGFDEEIIEAYRNYYQDQLKKPCNIHDACIYANQGKCLKSKYTWTRREKPNFINL